MVLYLHVVGFVSSPLYPRGGETKEGLESREKRFFRGSLGLSLVSSLGKRDYLQAHREKVRDRGAHLRDVSGFTPRKPGFGRLPRVPRAPRKKILQSQLKKRAFGGLPGLFPSSLFLSHFFFSFLFSSVPCSFFFFLSFLSLSLSFLFFVVQS